MFDHRVLPLLKRITLPLAQQLVKMQVRADHVTVAGFVVGVFACVAVVLSQFWLALVLLLLNRLADGIDGELARLQEPTDSGAYLDIVLDFLFYNGFVVAFILLNPEANAIAGAVLMLSFVGTGISFLAFATLAAKRGISNPRYPSKSLYYLGGLTEGTETVIVFALFCLLPQYFAILAYCFAALCFITAAMRIVGGYQTLRAD